MLLKESPIEEIHLNEREKDVLILLSQSWTSQEISEILHISPYTISTHRKNILRKTAAKSMIELISLAIEKEWI